jgi:hypothetical protein
VSAVFGHVMVWKLRKIEFNWFFMVWFYLLKLYIKMIKLFILHRFIKQFGKRLRILRLENCTFLNNEVLYWISTCCPCLQGKFVKVKQIELSDFHDKIIFIFRVEFTGMPWFRVKCVLAFGKITHDGTINIG